MIHGISIDLIWQIIAVVGPLIIGWIIQSPLAKKYIPAKALAFLATIDSAKLEEVGTWISTHCVTTSDKKTIGVTYITKIAAEHNIDLSEKEANWAISLVTKAFDSIKGK